MKGKTLHRFYTILKLLNALKEPAGKTFIQKAIYILQEGYSLDLDYKFKLYLYGPYSEILAGDIDTLEYSKLITIDYNDNYGYQIKITQNGIEFLEKYKSCIKNFNELDEKIIKLLSLPESKTAREMELLGTTLYFMKYTNDTNQLIRSIKMIKPRFDEQEIKEAIKKISETILSNNI